MQDWADAFNARIYLHASDREWIMRDSSAITLWEGDALEILPAVQLLRWEAILPEEPFCTGRKMTVLCWRAILSR